MSSAPDVTTVAVEVLEKADYNPRRITDAQFAALKKSLLEDPAFFQARPCLVNRRDGKLVVYAGNMRLEAAKALGWARVPCVVDQIPLLEEKRRNLKDNNAFGEYVEEQLAELAYEIQQGGLAVDSLGFDKRQLDALLTEGMLNTDGHGAMPDEVPPVLAEAVSKPGELYELGPHRVMCGSTRAKGDLAQLMDGQVAALLSTDPPYLVDYDGLARPGGGKDWSQTYQDVPQDQALGFFAEIFTNSLAVCQPAIAIYCWLAHRWYGFMMELWKQLELVPHQEIVWVKPAVVVGFAYYSWRHEPCLFGWRKGFKPEFNSQIHKRSTVWAIPYLKPGDPTTPEYYSDVWELDWEGKKRNPASLHPTTKPVGIFEIPMRIHTKQGDICLEPFAGSGSQLIAAERTGRRCFAMEIQPVFVDVIRDRYARFMKKPELAAHPEDVKMSLHDAAG